MIADEENSAGPTILTVTGSVEHSNRGPSDGFSDAFFAFHDIEFDRAFAFDRAQLGALGIQSLHVSYPGWPEDGVVVAGPRLAAVLDHVGATGETVTVRALDGYAVTFDRETIADTPAILAIDANGDPLGIGGRGPVWLVLPSSSYAGQPKDDAPLVWSAFHIAIE